MLKNITCLTFLTTALLSLSACSTTGTGTNSNAGDAMTGGNNGVQTSGIGDNDGQNSVGGLTNPNAMIPGANQKYFFDFNKSDVHNTDLPSIKVQAQYLISHPSAKASIQGNTDIRGSREYNIALGQRRAEAVKKTLILNGSPENQLHTMSYGAEKPVALGNTESDYAQNRRADMIYETH